MPNFQPQRLASLHLGQELQAALRAQDKHNTDISQALNAALVRGDTLQVLTPYTAASPLVVPTDWKTPTLLNGYTVQATVAYRKDLNGIVWGRGAVTIPAGPPVAGTIIYAMGSAYGYDGNLDIAVPATSNAGPTGFAVDNSGNVKMSIVVGAAGWLSLAFSYASSDREPQVPSCFPFDVLWTKPYPPSLMLAQCLDKASATPTNMSTCLPDWITVMQGGQTLIRVRNIPGLLPSTSYSVTLVAL